jgi:hypothetical protein
MVKRATASANGAVADPDVIQIGIDFKLDPTAVARALIRSLHIVVPSSRFLTEVASNGSL